MNIKNHRIAILGLGAEGWSTYQFLRSQDPTKKLTIADAKSLQDFTVEQRTTLEKDSAVELLLGDDYLKKLDNYDLIFKAPGIPPTQPEIQQALKKGALLSSNTQLFFELCPGKIIGITGTKGKSTTAALIDHLLKNHGLKTILAGNIGVPVLSMLEKIDEDTLVILELSSHQLATMTASPQVAVVQEVTSEHLDYYADTEAYQAAKSAITRYQQPSDMVVYNPTFAATAGIAALSAGKHLRYSLAEGPDSLAFIRGKNIIYRDRKQHTATIVSTDALPLTGEHNLHNVLAAIVVGRLFNLDPEEISHALQNFQALPHRLELVLERKNIRYIDDSLATTPHATINALQIFDEPVVLIAGGHERHQDFADLARVIINQKVIGLVLLPTTGERLAVAVKAAAEEQGAQQTIPQITTTTSMAAAVKESQAIIKAAEIKKGIILMSPASASFGLFTDYHDRGMQFQEAALAAHSSNYPKSE